MSDDVSEPREVCERCRRVHFAGCPLDAADQILEFGTRYRGRKMRKIPAGYLDWFLSNVRSAPPEVIALVKLEAERRRDIQSRKREEIARRRDAARDPMGWGGPRNGG